MGTRGPRRLYSKHGSQFIVLMPQSLSLQSGEKSIEKRDCEREHVVVSIMVHWSPDDGSFS
jgi:hypothetical protein